MADIVLNVDYLPAREQDVNVLSRSINAGGCAFNASRVYQQLGLPFQLFSPVGTGMYGAFVRNALKERGLEPAIEVSDVENGMCLCFVEPDGERTFLSDHGAEYFFKKEWFEKLNIEEFDSVYICGLEVEDKTGDVIVEFLEENPQLQIYFAPGPRICFIDSGLMNRIFALKPILHINERESIDFACKIAAKNGLGKSYEKAKDACQFLCSVTNALVVVTLGKNGAYFCESFNHSPALVPSISTKVVDVIGAGDAHIGAFIALRKKGFSTEQSVLFSNRIAAAVTEMRAASLPDNHPVFKEVLLN